MRFVWPSRPFTSERDDPWRFQLYVFGFVLAAAVGIPFESNRAGLWTTRRRIVTATPLPFGVTTAIAGLMGLVSVSVALVS